MTTVMRIMVTPMMVLMIVCRTIQDPIFLVDAGEALEGKHDDKPPLDKTNMGTVARIAGFLTSTDRNCIASHDAGNNEVDLLVSVVLMFKIAVISMLAIGSWYC